MTNLQDLTGKVFTRLTVLKFHSIKINKNGKKRRQWICRCECGETVIASTGELNIGNTKSCGCYHKDLVTKMATTHNRAFTKEYYAYRQMLFRCLNPKYEHFHRYGGRGIKICNRWLECFENFFEDMGECPKGYSLDRFPNNDGDYKKSNCRWATKEQQSDNRCNVVHYEINGFIMNQKESAKYIGIATGTLTRAIKKGFTIEQVNAMYGNKTIYEKRYGNRGG